MTRLALLPLVLLCVACSADDPGDPPEGLAAMRDWTGVLNGTCACVAGGPTTALTALHCDHGQNTIETHEGLAFSATLAAEWPMPDLAELAVNGVAWDTAPVQRVPVAGEPAVMIHHLDGWGAWAETQIHAVSLDEAQFNGVVLEGGMSGSPIFGFDLALLCVVTGGGVETGLGYCAIPPEALP